MEKQKTCDPKFSESFKEVTAFMVMKRAGKTGNSKNGSMGEQ